MNPELEAGRSHQAKELAEVLRTHREEILSRWAALCREGAKSRTLSEEELLDHLPRLLDRLAAAVEASSEGMDTTLPLKESRDHTLHRLDTGFDLPEITNEYALLRRVIFNILAARAPHLVVGGFDVVGNAIDESLSESVEYYVRVRHRTLEALDEVAQVVTGPGDLDSILHRLLTVAKQTIPAVDSVTVLLREGDRLKVREAIGVTAERDPSFSLKVGDGFAGTVAATGQPMFLPAAAESPLVRSEFLRERNVKALYGVPMVRGAQVIGVAHIASLTAHAFAEEDMLLFRTVTERATSVVVQADLMAREQSARLFLETVIGNIKEGVLVADTKGRIVVASEGAARIFGTPKQDLLTNAEELLPRFLPRSPEGEPLPASLLEALHGREVAPHERVVTDLAGRDHYVIASAAPVRSDGFRGAVVVFVDVTERRDLEDQLRLAIAFRERLMGIVSHDLRTPLTAISMAAQLMLARSDATPWVHTAAGRVQRSVERMTRMVSDLLDFTRIQAHAGLPIERSELDFCAVIKEAVDELGVAHPGRIELHLDCPHAHGSWDADRLDQVVTNLVTNALQHGGKTEPVSVNVVDLGQQVRLTVTNRGETIPPDQLPTLFDPFRRASSEKRGGGLGLGLHIVAEVAKAHGGTATVESRHGLTTFTVTLPK